MIEQEDAMRKIARSEVEEGSQFENPNAGSIGRDHDITVQHASDVNSAYVWIEPYNR